MKPMDSERQRFARPVLYPRLVELIERRKLRKKIASVVSRLIDALHAIDGDPDVEPSLGAPGHMEALLWTYEPG